MGLPDHIQAYLEEAGFTATEILVLRKLIEEDTMTVRQLAAKTGKSTGVLDQSVKKLIRKGILRKEMVNGSSKYVLGSLDGVVDWVTRDMQKKREQLHRKHQDFESYISTLKMDKNRPEMEYFEGLEGVQSAYLKLLDMGPELLRFLPMDGAKKEDRFDKFHVKYFKSRMKRKLFERVIAPDTVQGRRFQSRDPFEYRKTVLVPSKSRPFLLEEIIVGDTVACFDHEKKRVCFVHYPELVQSKREEFEMMFSARTELAPMEALINKQSSHSLSGAVPKVTHYCSRVRDFALSKKGISAFTVSIVFSLILTLFAYSFTMHLLIESQFSKLRSIAQTAVIGLDSSDFSKINFARDMKTQEYQEVFSYLNSIRDAGENIKYAYILRPSGLEDDSIWQFVVDADSSFELIDMGDEEVIAPGTYYEVSVSCPALYASYKTGFYQAVTENGFTSDQWGTFLSAYAPIRNGESLVGVLGLDMDVTDLHELTKRNFTFAFSFALFLMVLILVRILTL